MIQNINPWFTSPLGEKVLGAEMAIMDQLLPGLFGYHLVQLSAQNRPLFNSSPVRHKFIVGCEQNPECEHGLLGDSDCLPFEENSIDVLLLHHVLDFHDVPQNLLREIARVSLPMGYVVIVGFNPYSLWGLWKPFGALRKKSPWQGNFISPSRLMDWLNLLNFQIDRVQYFLHGFPHTPLRGDSKQGKPDYSQGLSRNTNWPFGAGYVIVARKQVGTMTAIKPRWKEKRVLGKLEVVRPATGRDIATRNTRPRD